jgi:hypothetical protein
VGPLWVRERSLTSTHARASSRSRKPWLRRGGPESAGRPQTPSTSPMMIATTDTRTTMAAVHHCQSPRRPLPGGITTRTLAAVGKPRLKAGPLPVSPECRFIPVPIWYILPVPLGVALSAYSHTPGEREGGRPSRKAGPPAFRVPGRFAVSRRGPRRQENPRLAGAGSANPGFYAESGDCHSVRERTARGQPENMASPFIGPLFMAASILKAPQFPPAPQRTGQGLGCE